MHAWGGYYGQLNIPILGEVCIPLYIFIFIFIFIYIYKLVTTLQKKKKKKKNTTSNIFLEGNVHNPPARSEDYKLKYRVGYTKIITITMIIIKYIKYR